MRNHHQISFIVPLLLVPGLFPGAFLFAWILAAYGIIKPLSSPYWQQEGGAVSMKQHLFSFFVSVVASVVGYYICKWLDRHHHDN